MNRKGFTLIELLVVIAVIALLLAILMPTLRKAKELGQRAVCLSSVRQLTLAWRMYADDNDDEICAANVGHSKWGWIANHVVDATPAEQIESIQAGMLFPYLETMGIYTCPTAKKDEVRSYSAVSSMNSIISNSKGKVYKKLLKIKNSHSMLVFVCEGEISNYAYSVAYHTPAWNDFAPIRHSLGTVFSFVDGHSESWKWKDPDTIAYTRWKVYGELPGTGITPSANQPGNPDLERVQKGMWGELGY